MKKACLLNLVIFILTIGLLSCAKGEAGKCEVQKVDATIDVNLGSVSKSANVWRNTGQTNTYNWCIAMMNSSSSNGELATVLSSVGLEKTGIDRNKVVGSFLFVRADLSKVKSATIIRENVDGAIIYYREGAVLMANYYKAKDADWSAVEEVAGSANFISSNQAVNLMIPLLKGRGDSVAYTALLFYDETRTDNEETIGDLFLERSYEYSEAR